jgi:hypothetical protein
MSSTTSKSIKFVVTADDFAAYADFSRCVHEQGVVVHQEPDRHRHRGQHEVHRDTSLRRERRCVRNLGVWMLKLPKPLVRCDQGALVPPSLAAAVGARSPLGCGRCIQDVQEPLGHFKVRLVAGMMKGDQDLVGQPARMTQHGDPSSSRRIR